MSDDPYEGTVFQTVRQFGYFGYDNAKIDHPIPDDEIVPTPVGEKCMYCGEEIADGDAGIIYANGPVGHRECGFRSAAGSLAHLQKRCSCFVPGSTENDDPGMTRREAALAAWEYAQEIGWFKIGGDE